MKLRGLWHGLLPAETIAKRLLPKFLPKLHVYYSLLGTAAQKPWCERTNDTAMAEANLEPAGVRQTDKGR